MIEPHLNRNSPVLADAARLREFIRERREGLMDETGEAMPSGPRPPRHHHLIAEIGNVKAKFSGEWMESPREQARQGHAATDAQRQAGRVDGCRRARCMGRRRFWKKQQADDPFSGRRKSDGKSVSVDISIPEDKFKPADAIESGGVFKEGRVSASDRWACSSSTAKPSSPRPASRRAINSKARLGHHPQVDQHGPLSRRLAKHYESERMRRTILTDCQ